MKRKKKKKQHKKTNLSKKRIVAYILIIFVVLWAIIAVYHLVKPLPKGINIEGEEYYVSEEDIEFLYDLTSFDENNNTIIEQQIFERALEMIDNAETFILVNLFLFEIDDVEENNSLVSAKILKDKLIEKKKENPDIKINFITDEYNTNYGSYKPIWLSEFEENNINIIFSDLTKLRDISPVYSGFWRTYVQWLGTPKKEVINTGPDKKIKIRSKLKKLNKKFDHRKVIITDEDDKLVSLVTSANLDLTDRPYSNTGVLIKNKIWKDILDHEKTTANLSNSKLEIPDLNFANKNISNESHDISVQLLTESKIGESLVNEIELTQKGESIDLAIFLLSDRRVIKSLLKASKRDVEIRLILDPSKTLFEREKYGIPNRPTAYELVKKSKGKIKVRWYNTGTEQFHTKLAIMNQKNKTIIFIGSANFVRQSIGSRTHLETDIKIDSPNNKEIAKEVNEYFNKMWNNNGSNYTNEFEKYKDSSKIRKMLYWLKETTDI